jgi:hypothetical protein
VPPAPPLPSGKKKRVHIIEDRFNECGGTVEAESEDYIVVLSKGKLRGFYKARVRDIIQLVDPEPGQPGTVTMRDGMVYRGTIIADNFDDVEIEIEGIRQKLPRTAVLHTVLTLTPQQVYERMRKEIKRDAYSDRLSLARYLYDKRMYVESRDELLALLEDVDLHEAKELLRVVSAQLALGTPLPKPITDDGEDPEVGERGVPGFRDTLPKRLLTPEEVNLIRVYEIDFRQPPRVTVTPELIREMIEKYSSSNLIPASADGRNALFRKDPVELVRLLFDLRARDLYGKIKVDTEPFALNLFRQRVHNAWLINSCATSGCHGGVDAGRFFLHRFDAKDAQVRYTNLLILDRLKLPDRPPLIDWDNPMNSLIVQFGLPRQEARFPHPDVKGWKPVFTQSNRKLLEDFERWVKAMYRPRPDYPVDYAPPDLTAPDSPAPADAQRVPR